jgi:hypothetical protein
MGEGTGSGSTELLMGAKAEKLLSAATLANAFVCLAIPSPNYACGGTLWEVSGNRLKVALDASVEVGNLAVFSLCTLYWVYDGQAYLGLSRITNVERGGDVSILELEAPEHLLSAQPRSSERIPVPSDCGLKAFLFTGGQLIRARVLNVSLNGMLVNSDSSIPDVEVGSVVQVQARWDDISINLPGLVRWIDGSNYGLFFNNSASVPGTGPLFKIVQRLMMSDQPKAA